MLEINSHLVARPDERVFFDTQGFRVIKLNHRAHTLLSSLPRRFTSTEFIRHGGALGLTLDASERFLARCESTGIIVHVT